MIQHLEGVLSTILQEPIRLIMTKEPKKGITMELLRDMVCVEFSLPWSKIISRKRSEDIVYARMSFSYLAREYTSDSDKKIGDFIQRHRSSVITNYQSIANLMFAKDMHVYPYLKEIIYSIKKMQHEG